MHKPRILIYAPMHARPLVSELFCLGAQRLADHHKDNYKITVHAAVSDDQSIAVCRKYGVSTTTTTNDYLGRKLNAGLQDAMRFEWDYVLMMGDDDVAANKLLDRYDPYIRKGSHHFGVKSIYFYHPGTRSAAYFSYKFNCNKLIGAGKMISRHAVEKTGWQLEVCGVKPQRFMSCRIDPGQLLWIPEYQARYLAAMGQVRITTGKRAFLLWDNYLKRGVDAYGESQLLLNGFEPELVCHKGDQALITDVKSNCNIWSFDKLKKRSQTATQEEATAFWSDEEKQWSRCIV